MRVRTPVNDVQPPESDSILVDGPDGSTGMHRTLRQDKYIRRKHVHSRDCCRHSLRPP